MQALKSLRSSKVLLVPSFLVHDRVEAGGQALEGDRNRSGSIRCACCSRGRNVEFRGNSSLIGWQELVTVQLEGRHVNKIALLHMRYLQFVEKCQQDGFLAAWLSIVFLRVEMVPVERDLTTLRQVKDPVGVLPVIVELGPDNDQSYELNYPLRSRQARKEQYFNRGYRSFAMVREGVVIGDIWYVSHATSSHVPLHSHLRWFGIDLGVREVYTFDMHVLVEERGNSLTTWFMTNVLSRLHDMGYDKNYGYFAVGNQPSIWLHRLIGYKEMGHVVLYRFLFFEIARALGKSFPSRPPR